MSDNDDSRRASWDHASSRATAAAQLAEIAAARPSAIAASYLAKRSSLPFKAALYRDSLLWRIEELGRCALCCYDSSDHVSAILLTRATMETVAALHSLHRRIKRYKGGDADALDATIMSMALGSRVREDRPDAPGIMGAIDKVTKDAPAFRSNYDQLSEYAHPNDAGTASSYSVLNVRPLAARFTAEGEDFDRRAWLLIESLAICLLLVMPLHGELLDYAAEFARICDVDIEPE